MWVVRHHESGVVCRCLTTPSLTPVVHSVSGTGHGSGGSLPRHDRVTPSCDGRSH